MGFAKVERYNADKQKRKEILAELSGRPEKQGITFDSFDKLNLKEYGMNLIEIIRQSSTFVKSNDNKSYVIGIDAGWGTGKTTFLTMLYNKLDECLSDKKEDILPVYYNAWKGDFWNNAFEPFFDCIWNSVPRWGTALKLYDLASTWNIPVTKREDASIDRALKQDLC